MKPKRFSDDMLEAFRRNSERVLGEMTSKDPESRKVYDHYKRFQDSARTWARIGEGAISYAKSLGWNRNHPLPLRTSQGLSYTCPSRQIPTGCI